MAYKVFRQGISKKGSKLAYSPTLYGTFKKKEDAVERMEQIKFVEKMVREESPNDFKNIKSQYYIENKK
jgi:hypothetical protein